MERAYCLQGSIRVLGADGPNALADLRYGFPFDIGNNSGTSLLKPHEMHVFRLAEHQCELRHIFGKPSTCIRSEEHTSELQSHSDLVCRLLLEKKKPYDFIHS